MPALARRFAALCIGMLMLTSWLVDAGVVCAMPTAILAPGVASSVVVPVRASKGAPTERQEALADHAGHEGVHAVGPVSPSAGFPDVATPVARTSHEVSAPSHHRTPPDAHDACECWGMPSGCRDASCLSPALVIASGSRAAWSATSDDRWAALLIAPSSFDVPPESPPPRA